MNKNTIEQEFLDILECPVCHANLELDNERLVCVNADCKLQFPIIDGIPVMFSQDLKNELKISRNKWDLEYERYHQIQDIDLINDLELKDSLTYIKKFRQNREGVFLEAGCGASKISCSLAKEGVKTIGIDFSLNALRTSQALFQREGVRGYFVCGDILKMPFKKEVFSFIYTGGVIEHFRDTQLAVNEIYRCLDINGVTLNTVPNISLSTIYRVLRWGNIPDIPLLSSLVEFVEIGLLRKKFMRFGYEKSFTGKKMQKFFDRSGFEYVKVGFFQTYYPFDWVKSENLKKILTNIANTRMFWPMIYVLAEKTQQKG